MTDRDLALWMQGAAAMIGDRVPTELEWASIKERVDAVIGERVADRLAGNKDMKWNLELLKFVEENRLQRQLQQQQYGLWWWTKTPDITCYTPKNTSTTL